MKVIGNWLIGNWKLGRSGLLIVVVAGLILSALLLARGGVPVGAQVTVPAGDGGNAGGGVAVAFVPVDVWVDSGNKRLGAYQVEVVAKEGMIVGLEGGESKAFGEAPYYDPAALQGNRIIVAAFSTDENLPTGLTRVARLHMMVNGEVKAGEMPAMTEKLVVATDGEGKTVDVKLTLRPMQGAIR